MNKTIFLYLDFLGFRELSKNPNRVLRLFETLDSCRIHRDSNFRSIVFSDTLLAYNCIQSLSSANKATEVMFLIELVEDITHRLTGSGITFRAIISEGQFETIKMRNFEAFFGSALIEAYDAESSLSGLGLYLREDIASFDRVFKSITCEKGFRYSLLAYDLIRADELDIPYPIPPIVTEWAEAGIEERVQFQIYHLRQLHEGTFHESEKIRAKFEAAWSAYATEHPRLATALTRSNFRPEGICELDWTEAEAAYQERVKFFQS